MKKTITLVFAAILVANISAPYAFASGGSEHQEVEIKANATDTKEVVMMKEVITILQQMIALLKQKNGDHREAEDAALAVWIELHSNKTHAHVREPGKTEISFILEGISYTEEDKVVAAIAEKTGLAEKEIEAVIKFPSGAVDENGDSTDMTAEYDDNALAGIHIMGDGTVMWGNGTPVDGATITVDGKVKLSDGQVVTPKFDLR